jgi:hypothetical protein
VAVRRWRRAVLLALVPVSVAGCSLAYGIPSTQANVWFHVPPLLSRFDQPPPLYDLMQVSMKVTTNQTPLDLHMELELFRWDPFKLEFYEYRRAFWNITDLAAPGQSVVWRAGGPYTGKWRCRSGRYYSKWIADAVSSSGHPQHGTYYYPYDPGTKRKPKPKGKYPPNYTQAKAWNLKC